MGQSQYKIVLYQHPYKVTIQQTQKLPWCWKAEYVAASQIPSFIEFYFMDDFGTFWLLDRTKSSFLFPYTGY